MIANFLTELFYHLMRDEGWSLDKPHDWVIHFGLKDAAERQAAIDAVNMASKALESIRDGRE